MKRRLGSKAMRHGTPTLWFDMAAVGSCLVTLLGLCVLVIGVIERYSSPLLLAVGFGAPIFGIASLRDSLKRRRIWSKGAQRHESDGTPREPDIGADGELTGMQRAALNWLHQMARTYARAAAVSAIVCVAGLGVTTFPHSSDPDASWRIVGSLCVFGGGSGAGGFLLLWWVARRQLAKVR